MLRHIPFLREERSKDVGGCRLLQTGIHLRGVMAGRLPVETHAIVDGATLRVFGTVVEPANARKGNGGRAHGTGFQRYIEVGAGQPLLTKRLAGHPNDGDFSVSCDIVELAGAVAGCRDHGPVNHQNRSDRHLAALSGCAGLVERQLHKLICLHDPTIST